MPRGTWQAWLLPLAVACAGGREGTPTVRVVSAESTAPGAGRHVEGPPPTARGTETEPSPEAADAAPSHHAALHPAPQPGFADVDPSNDGDVAPPDAVEDCEDRLRAAGVTIAPAKLPLHQKRGGRYTCGSAQAVVYQKGPTGLRFTPAPIVTCTLALALARFERLLQEEAQRHVGSEVKSVRQMGTYVCRRMAQYPDWVSEHSYGNAIDLESFTLANGRSVSVLRHYEPERDEPERPEGRFLRAVARRAWDERVFSVVLTPRFDRLHRNHFHFDMARYRADGR